MSNAQARLLQLLELLQSRRAWTGEELASRLGVSTRTVRASVARLRELGFPVEAQPGVAGGYELRPGSRMAPLVLEDDEAIAVAIGLRTAASTGVEGVEQAALGALAKLSLVLPEHLRRRVDALQAAITPLRWGGAPQAGVPADVLAVLSQACRDRVQVRFDYRDREGRASRRTVEPHALVPAGPRWYLVAFDLDRDDWRTFRVDRTDEARALRRRSSRRTLPGGDPAAWVRDGLSAGRVTHAAVVRLHCDLERAREQVGHGHGSLHAEAPSTTRFEVDVHELSWLAMRLAMLDVEVEVVAPDDLRTEMARLAERLHRAASH